MLYWLLYVTCVSLLLTRYLSKMEDMQGKIRGFVRVREVPSATMSVVDEFTVRKNDAQELGDEYAFDKAFSPDSTNQQVCTFVCTCLKI